MYVPAIFILQKSCNIPLRNGKEINKIEKKFLSLLDTSISDIMGMGHV